MTSTQCLRRPSCLTWVQWGLCQGRFPMLKQDWRPAQSPFGEHTCVLWFTATLINLSVTSRSNPSMPSQTSLLDVPRLVSPKPQLSPFRCCYRGHSFHAVSAILRNLCRCTSPFRLNRSLTSQPSLDVPAVATCLSVVP